jgi:glutathione S-transferase
MLMLTLYHYDHSTAAQKIRIALAEKQLDWESHHLDTSVTKREHFSPEYLKINPRGIVPTLVHDGNVIRESQVILEYLDDAFPDPPLRPASAVDKATMRLWTKLIDEGLHVHSRVVGMCIVVRHAKSAAGPAVLANYLNEMPEIVRKENDRINIAEGLDSPLLPGAVRYFRRVFEDMNTALADTPWLAGETFSLADISLGVYVTRLKSFQMAPLWNDLQHLNEWYGRFTARPSYDEGVTKWGDQTTAKRERYGDEAFKKISELWNAQ